MFNTYTEEQTNNQRLKVVVGFIPTRARRYTFDSLELKSQVILIK